MGNRDDAFAVRIAESRYFYYCNQCYVIEFFECLLWNFIIINYGLGKIILMIVKQMNDKSL